MFTDCAQEMTGVNMRKREIWLPDKIDDIALVQARTNGMEISAFYAALLSDNLLNGQSAKFRAGSSIPAGMPEQVTHDDNEPSAPGSQPRRVYGRVEDADENRPLHECDSGEFEEAPGKGDYDMICEFGEDPPLGIAGIFKKVPE